VRYRIVKRSSLGPSLCVPAPACLQLRGVCALER
jgi:hypothetical protein